MKKTIFILCGILCAVVSHAQTWMPLSVGISSGIVDISFPSDDTGFVTLDNGTIRRTYDGGVSWSVIPSPNSFNGSIEFLTGSKGFILTDSGITTTGNCGVSWNATFSSLNVYSWGDIYFVNSDSGYAVGVNMNSDTFFVFSTNDGGVT